MHAQILNNNQLGSILGAAIANTICLAEPLLPLQIEDERRSVVDRDNKLLLERIMKSKAKLDNVNTSKMPPGWVAYMCIVLQYLCKLCFLWAVCEYFNRLICSVEWKWRPDRKSWWKLHRITNIFSLKSLPPVHTTIIQKCRMNGRYVHQIPLARITTFPSCIKWILISFCSFQRTMKYRSLVDKNLRSSNQSTPWW